MVIVVRVCDEMIIVTLVVAKVRVKGNVSQNVDGEQEGCTVGQIREVPFGKGHAVSGAGVGRYARRLPNGHGTKEPAPGANVWVEAMAERSRHVPLRFQLEMR